MNEKPGSIPILIRDAMVDRLKAIAWFANFHFTTNKSMQIQPQDVPFCGVYFIDQQMVPDGDANVGEVRFRTTARIGFSIIVQNNDMVQAEYHLDTAFLFITTLFTDPTLYNNQDFKIQAFMRGVRSHQFGALGQNNETPIAELRFDLTCDLGVITYPPTVEDVLETIHVTTQFPSGGTPAEIEAVQQVEAQYDIPQGISDNMGSRMHGWGTMKVNATVV